MVLIKDEVLSWNKSDLVKKLYDLKLKVSFYLLSYFNFLVVKVHHYPVKVLKLIFKLPCHKFLMMINHINLPYVRCK